MKGKLIKEFITPKVFISKCIGFESCRWNGKIIKSPFVEVLKKYVDFIPVCPEVEIKLGIPRDPIRIVKEEEKLHLVQISSQKDYTNEMESFKDTYLNNLKTIDGFILKSRSPSCGLYQTKYYASKEKNASIVNRGAGIFGNEVLKRFKSTAIETEGRLKNFILREHWLIKLYSLSDFRKVKDSNSKYELIEYHTRNKLLFMAYDQNTMREMGKITANLTKVDFGTLIETYEKLLYSLFIEPPKSTSHINVLLHALGYFKNKLNHKEKAHFLDELQKFRAGWIPLFVLITLLSSWIITFDEHYLFNQTYFKPYPEELMNFDLRDTWRGKYY